MKLLVATAVVTLVLSGISGAEAAMSTVPYLGPNDGARSDSEPNRLTGSTKGRSRSGNGSPPVQFMPLNPYLSLMPMAPAQQPEPRREGPGFLNLDPFDPNSDVNRLNRSLYANPYPYDPIYNPYGQGSSPYAPGGGQNVPMGNGMPWGR
jgi:hypothetical protein